MMKKIMLLFAFFILLLLLSSCKDAKAEKSDKITKEVVSETNKEIAMVYQCPMDCEPGKTYDAAGTCPVCKMNLKAAGKETAMACTMHKDGKCENCTEHSKKMSCEKHKDGNCDCKAKKHDDHNVVEKDEKASCAMHKDGNCTCKA